ADAHLEIAVHVKLQDKAVAAGLVRRPRLCPADSSHVRPRAASRDPDVIIVININAVLAGRPDAAGLGLALASHEARIGGAAPGSQQLAVGVKLQNRRRGFAAIGDRAIGALMADAIDRVTLLGGAAGRRSFQAGLFRGHAARAIVYP